MYISGRIPVEVLVCDLIPEAAGSCAFCISVLYDLILVVVMLIAISSILVSGPVPSQIPHAGIVWRESSAALLVSVGHFLAARGERASLVARVAPTVRIQTPFLWGKASPSGVRGYSSSHLKKTVFQFG